MAALTAEDLRREFDASFARVAAGAATDLEDFLAIRVARRPYALRVAELGGVAAGRRITAVPSRNAALAGLVGVRGALVPVFDLCALLGEERSHETPHWVALSAGASPIGLAFAEVDGHLRVPGSALSKSEPGASALVRDVIRSESELRPIVSVVDVSRLILEQAGKAGLKKGT